MSRRKQQQWNFGELCGVVRNHYWQMAKIGGQEIRNNQEKILFLLYYCGLNKDMALLEVKSSSGTPSNIFNSKKGLPDEYIENISNPDKETECLDKIKEIFSTTVLKKNELIQDLIKITRNMEGFKEVKESKKLPTTIDEQSKFFLKCLRCVVKLPK